MKGEGNSQYSEYPAILLARPSVLIPLSRPIPPHPPHPQDAKKGMLGRNIHLSFDLSSGAGSGRGGTCA